MRFRLRFDTAPLAPVLALTALVMLGGMGLGWGTAWVQAEEQAEAEALEPFPHWDEIETLGEEDEMVEIVFEDGWTIIGERGEGIGVYDAPPYQVAIRKWEDVPNFPCSDCHNKRDIDYTRRVLVEDHQKLVVDHANNRMWCTDCHDGEGLDYLVSKNGRPIDMDLGYLQCGGCHFREFKDWEYGAHGKRVGLWRGTRVLYTCTECHNAHTPQIALEEAVPPPGVRKNLAGFTQPAASHPRMWEWLTPTVESNR